MGLNTQFGVSGEIGATVHATGMRRFVSGEDGFSIIEVMMASIILTVGLLALASTAIPSIRALHVAEGRQAATAAATRTLETARQLPYEQVAMSDSTFSAGAHDPDGDGPLSSERLVVTAEGAIVDGLPYWGAAGDQVTIQTHVALWCDGVLPCETLGDEAGRRVTVTANWRTAGGMHSKRTSTIIARTEP
jgi:prepilin-type N-terminal cleavage/methylation domain-containing protein